jgi:hypothetical protein
MDKNTASRTATTFTMDPALSQLDGPDRDELVRPYVWKTEQNACEAVEMFRMTAPDMYRVTEHAAPGLEAYAIYRTGRDTEAGWVLMSVIVFEDDTAARLHKAVRREQPVTVTYVKADGTETVRTIEPTGLSTTKAGNVIVKALDRRSDEARSFRIDRVRTYTVHRSRRTVRTETPAPSKAGLWTAWTARQREFAPVGVVEVQSWTGAARYVSRTEYDRLLAARDPREPKAADETCSYETDVYSTDPNSFAALQAPEDVQNKLAEAYARGQEYVLIPV